MKFQLKKLEKMRNQIYYLQLRWEENIKYRNKNIRSKLINAVIVNKIIRILNLRIYVVKETKLLYNKHIKS